jgi:hypothetical protein
MISRDELINKIIEKKDFSQLPRKDVELAFEKFEKKTNSEYQSLKLTRNFLRKIYSSFSSRKLFGETVVGKDKGWILMKHKSTKERLEFYSEIYSRIFENISGAQEEISIFDLGCGVNGLTFDLIEKNIKKLNNQVKVNYVGVEAVGQLVDLGNNHFKENKLDKKCKYYHESLFDTKKIKNIINTISGFKIIFLFKVIDSLEVLERNYSKTLISWLLEDKDLGVDLIVLSFATRSLGNRKKFSVQRGWLLKFIDDNFKILDNFEVGGEKYIVFEKRNY